MTDTNKGKQEEGKSAVAGPVTGEGSPSAIPPNALHSLYGGKKARALSGAGERPQEIYTPRLIIDAILRVWPHIEMDPCSGPHSIVPSNQTCFVAGKTVPATKNGQVVPGKFKTVFTADNSEIDGLLIHWPDYTYVNPPFALLEEWLCKAAHEGGLGREVMMLAPLRPHRRWFRACTKEATICDLNPFAFVGHKTLFPAPMCMIYWGGLRALFEESFNQIGGVRWDARRVR